MNEAKRKRLEEAGFRLGTVGELFHLSKVDEEMIELRVALASTIRRLRERRELSQSRLAELLDSGQARVSKIESADPSVSLDLMVRTALTLGVTRGELAETFSLPRRRANQARQSKSSKPRVAPRTARAAAGGASTARRPK